MRVHFFQHAPSEGLGRIEGWVQSRGHSLSGTHLYRGELPPPVDSLDFLIVMGGGMNIYQHRFHPWLVEEKRFLGEAIAAGKRVLGVCLGAQLIADVLGARVCQNPEIEIGWLPVRVNEAARKLPILKGFPADLVPLHWHGDTFELPPGAVHLAESDGCRNQAFLFGDRVVGLQFHLEAGPREVHGFVEDLHGESGPYVQKPEEILNAEPYATATQGALESLLDALAAIRD